MYLNYLRDHPDVVWSLTLEHIRICLLAMAIALPIAIAVSILGVWVKPLRQAILWITGALYTIPGLAMIAFLIPTQGVGLKPTLILLVIYAQVFLVRNFITALTGVDAATLEAARGMGMRSWQVLLHVWIPMALPVMLAGVRIALTTVIGLAVLGGWVAAGGLGELLFTGIGTNNPAKVMAGVVAIVALAILANVLMRALEAMTPVVRAQRSRQA